VTLYSVFRTNFRKGRSVVFCGQGQCDVNVTWQSLGNMSRWL